MKKIGNSNSNLLDQLTKIASKSPESKPAFDINEILRQHPKQPTLQEIFADVMKTGKNIHKTAQMNSLPMSDPSEDLTGLDGALGDELGGSSSPDLDMPGGEEGETPCDQEAVKQNLVEALIALCGSPEAACDCIMSGQDATLQDDMGELPGDMGTDTNTEMPSLETESPEASPMPSPMPAPY